MYFKDEPATPELSADTQGKPDLEMNLCESSGGVALQSSKGRPQTWGPPTSVS